jgi:hypothetical protein
VIDDRHQSPRDSSYVEPVTTVDSISQLLVRRQQIHQSRRHAGAEERNGQGFIDSANRSTTTRVSEDHHRLGFRRSRQPRRKFRISNRN